MILGLTHSGNGFAISATSKGATSFSNFGSPAAIFPNVPQLAGELLAPPVDVIVPEGLGAANALDPKGRTPIVSPVLMDPVERGFAVSLSQPGGNITGFTLMHVELNGKRLDLLRSTFPQIHT